uniref:Uncharacterized protein n=1 Tax=Anguilla anguilla TaxID=7936 RepID=A0A0E9RQD9_ANGAN
MYGEWIEATAVPGLLILEYGCGRVRFKLAAGVK